MAVAGTSFLLPAKNIQTSMHEVYVNEFFSVAETPPDQENRSLKQM